MVNRFFSYEKCILSHWLCKYRENVFIQKYKIKSIWNDFMFVCYDFVVWTIGEENDKMGMNQQENMSPELQW